MSRDDDTRTLDSDGDGTGKPRAARPALIDRYEILDELGAGGEGTVYLAYDPQLDRRVALKLGRGRLAEGRALARLDHPNVVAVHDVGFAGDALFLVMALVEGETLAAWLAAAPRGWRDIVGRFALAGRGLAAAHALGIVHRDVKPSNVLVRGSGVWVADFGLAGAATGGTPWYAAPELAAGAPASPASDQFALCLALAEALGADAATARAPGWHGRGLAGPPRLGRAVARGLAADPARRWPTLDALLAELARILGARRRWTALAGGAVVVAVAAGGALWARGPREGLDCAAASAEIARALAGAPAADAAAAASLQRVHDHACQHHRPRAQACALARAREQAAADPPAWQRAHAASAACAQADRAWAGSAAEVARAIAASDAARRAGADEVSRARADAAAAQARVLAQPRLLAAALTAAGRARFADEDPTAAALLDTAIAIGEGDAQIDALLARAALAGVRGEAAAARPPLVRAEQLLAADPDPQLDPLRHAAARVRAHLLELGGDLDGALAGYRGALAAIERATGEGEPVIEPLLEVVRIELRRKQYPAARALAARARALAEAHVAADSDVTADVLELQGAIELAAAQPAAAADLFRRQLAIAEHNHGPRAAALAKPLLNLGGALDSLGQDPEAIAVLERGLAIATARWGADHPRVADLAWLLAPIHARRQDYARARDLARQAGDVFEARLPAGDPRRVSILQRRANIELRSGQPADAIPLYDRALRAARAADPAGIEVATVLGNRAVVLNNLGRHAEAEVDLRAALAQTTRRLGADHPRRLVPLVQLCLLELARQRPAAALPHLLDAERIIRAGGVALDKAAAVRLARIQLDLARTRDRRAARAATEALRRELAAAGLRTTDADQLLASLR